MTVRFHEPIKTRKASAVPGDDLLELTQAATDAGQRIWHIGSKLRPLSAGGDYRDVTMFPRTWCVGVDIDAQNEKEYTVNADDEASARAEARRWSGGRVVSCELHVEQLPDERVSLVG